MKKKVWIISAIIFILCSVLSGCKETQEKESNLPGYIVISEELDVQKTTNKVSEILDKAEENK